jgi:TolB protein
VEADDFPGFQFRLAADLPGSQREPSLSPDGRLVSFVMEDSEGVPQIWVMDLSGGEPLQVTSGEARAGAPFWSPIGDRIVFHRVNDGIWEVPPLGGEAHRLLERGIYPALSPSGDLLVFNDQRRPFIADGDGANPRPLEGFETSFFGYFARPVFAPDGERVVTFWPDATTPLGDLYVASVSGGEAHRLTDLHFLSWGARPTWSSDGRWIVFTSDHSGSTTLWRVPAEGGHPLPVTRGAGSDYSPDLSRNLDRLVYANGRNVARLEAFDPKSGRNRILYERRDLLICPRLSPDGDRAAFFTRASGSFHLFVVDLFGGDARQVTFGESRLDTQPVFSADGEWLYYYQQQPGFSFRRITVDGRRDEKLLGDWRWPIQHQTNPSPDGTQVVYVLRDGPRLVETRIRRLDTGQERTLPLALYDPQWTADGKQIYGATWRPSYSVNFCPVDGEPCRAVAEGWWARLGPAEKQLYVLREDPPQVWRHNLDTGEEHELFIVDYYDEVDFGWGVRPNGEVVHHAQYTGDLELWIGEAAPQ